MTTKSTGLVYFYCPICGIEQEAAVYVASVGVVDLFQKETVQLDPNISSQCPTHTCKPNIQPYSTPQDSV